MVSRAPLPPTYLRDQAISPATLTKYQTGVRRFIRFCSTQRIDWTNNDELDDALSYYIETIFADELPRSHAESALYGLIHFQPRLKTALAGSRRRLKGWTNLTPTKHHPPLTLEIACLIATRMALAGHLEESIATMLAFDCYLRINEFCNLRVGNLVLPGDARVGTKLAATVSIDAAKTGRHQSVTIRNLEVATLLKYFRFGKRASDRLFRFNDVAYRRVFHWSLSRFGLDGLGFVPHSLRHGGCTRDFLNGMKLPDLAFRGRWASTKSCETYVQASRALLMQLHIPQEVMEVGQACVVAYSRLFLWCLERQSAAGAASSLPAQRR